MALKESKGIQELLALLVLPDLLVLQERLDLLDQLDQ